MTEEWPSGRARARFRTAGAVVALFSACPETAEGRSCDRILDPRTFALVAGTAGYSIGLTAALDDTSADMHASPENQPRKDLR